MEVKSVQIESGQWSNTPCSPLFKHGFGMVALVLLQRCISFTATLCGFPIKPQGIIYKTLRYQ